MKKKLIRTIIEIVVVTIISRVIFTAISTGNFVKDIINMAIIIGILGFSAGLIEFYNKSKK